MRLPLVAAALLVAIVPLRAADAGTRDLVPPGRLPGGAEMSAKLQSSVWFDRSDLTYADGDTVRIFVEANQDAYVTVLDVGPTGDVTRLYPNAAQPASRIAAFRELVIGSAAAPIVVARPFGGEFIKVIVSSKPLDLFSRSDLEERGVFATVKGGTSALARDLAVLSGGRESAGISIVNRSIRTVPGRPS